MKLDLSEILANPGLRLPYEFEEPPIVDEDLECTEPTKGRFIFTNTGNVLLIEGKAATRVVLSCSRCLAYFEVPIELEVEEQFTLAERPIGPRSRAAEVRVEETDENPDAAQLFEGALFDLTELLRQDIMLSLPGQPLHDENCLGLCPVCGVNLNEQECSCASAVKNPALAELGKLLEREDS